MEIIIILCHEHGKFVIAAEQSLSHVCCPLCWHNDKIKAIVEPGEQKS